MHGGSAAQAAAHGATDPEVTAVRTLTPCDPGSRNSTPASSSTSFIMATLAGMGVRRPFSKQYKVDMLILAFSHSFSRDQFSSARAARHCSGLIDSIDAPFAIQGRRHECRAIFEETRRLVDDRVSEVEICQGNI